MESRHNVPLGAVQSLGSESNDEVVTSDGRVFLSEEKRWSRIVRRLDLPVQIARVAILAAVLIVWQECVSHGWGIKPIFSATPLQVWDYLKGAVVHQELWSNLLVTAREALLGWAIGAGAGTLVGLVLGQSKRLERVMNPFLTFANATPKIGIAPILIVWFGIGEPSKIVLAAVVVFFIVEVPVHATVALIDPDIDLVAATLGMSWRQRIWKVVLPGVLPTVLGSLRLGVVFGFLAAVFGEIIAAKSGMGQLLETSTNQFVMSEALGITIILAIVVLVVNAVLLVGERHLLRWTGSSSGRGEVVAP